MKRKACNYCNETNRSFGVSDTIIIGAVCGNGSVRDAVTITCISSSPRKDLRTFVWLGVWTARITNSSICSRQFGPDFPHSLNMQLWWRYMSVNVPHFMSLDCLLKCLSRLTNKMTKSLQDCSCFVTLGCSPQKGRYRGKCVDAMM